MKRAMAMTAMLTSLACSALYAAENSTHKEAGPGHAPAVSSDAGHRGMANRNEAKAETRESTLRGKLVDLRSWMTGEYGNDHTKTMTDNLRSGVPAVLDTPAGPIFVGSARSIVDKVTPFANQDAQISGKLYDRHGLRYVDLTAIEKPAAAKMSSTHTPTAGTSMVKSAAPARSAASH